MVAYFYTLEVLSLEAKGFVILYGMSVPGLRVETYREVAPLFQFLGRAAAAVRCLTRSRLALCLGVHAIHEVQCTA